MEEWLKDWITTIAVLIYFLYPLLKRWLERRRQQTEQRERAESGKSSTGDRGDRAGPRPEPRGRAARHTQTQRDRAGQQASERRSRTDAQGPKPRARANYQAPKQRPRARSEERRLQLFAKTVERLDSRLEQARSHTLALIELIGPDSASAAPGEHPLARLAEPLRREVLPAIERVRQALAGKPTVTGLREQTAALDEIEAGLAAIRALIEQRLSSAASVLQDVDAIARDSYAPFVSLAQTQPVHLKERIPVAVRGPIHPESLASTPLAPIQVPSGFTREVWGWPSIVQQVGKDLFFSVEHLALDLHARLGLPRQLPAPATELELQLGFPRVLFGPWLPEVFADLLATLMLGPAHVESLLRTLASPRGPQRGSAIMTDRGFIAESPPPRLRLYMACRALEQLGQQAEGDALWARWEAMHPNAQLFFFPLAGNWVGLSEHSLTEPADELVTLMLTEPWPELAGFRLREIPGLAYGKVEEARVGSVSASLSQGQRVDTDARWLVAAAVLAATEAPGAQPQILSAARRSLSPEPVEQPVQPAKRARVPSSVLKTELRRSLRDRAAVREAVVLGASLCPRPSGRGQRG